ncbi:hypothetical protein PLANTIT3_30097 [Plantibacter sp. T3]|nr:hypothetical protein PLANTIT3_30097 [Plantibacter sp. T3]
MPRWCSPCARSSWTTTRSRVTSRWSRRTSSASISRSPGRPAFVDDAQHWWRRRRRPGRWAGVRARGVRLRYSVPFDVTEFPGLGPAVGLAHVDARPVRRVPSPGGRVQRARRRERRRHRDRCSPVVPRGRALRVRLDDQGARRSGLPPRGARLGA